MISFVAKKILRIGYYEIFDDTDDLDQKGENLVQFDHMKAMKTIFGTIIGKHQSKDIQKKIAIASTILKSFQDEVKAQLSPSLPIELNFSLSGTSQLFKMTVSDFAGAITLLETLDECLTKIRSIPDIPHAELYQRVFVPGTIHEYESSETTENLKKSLD